MPVTKQMRLTPVSERDQIANSINFLAIYLTVCSEKLDHLANCHRWERNSREETAHELTALKSDLQTYSNRMNTLLEMLGSS